METKRHNSLQGSHRVLRALSTVTVLALEQLQLVLLIPVCPEAPELRPEILMAMTSSTVLPGTSGDEEENKQADSEPQHLARCHSLAVGTHLASSPMSSSGVLCERSPVLLTTYFNFYPLTYK